MPAHSIPLRERFLSKVRIFDSHEDDCWEWTANRTWDGYGIIRSPGGKANLRAPRVAYEMYRGLIPEGLMVCHSCDWPPCVNPNHLFLGTASDNQRDCSMKGRMVTHNKMPNEKVNEILASFVVKQSFQDVAEEFGVTPSCVWLIVRGKTKRQIAGLSSLQHIRRRRLTPEDVASIRAIGRSVPVSETALKFNVHTVTINAVLRGKLYPEI